MTNKKRPQRMPKPTADKEECAKQEPPQQRTQRLDPHQVADFADAGLSIINHDAGVIPNRVRNKVNGLEQLLIGLLNGDLAVVAVPKPTKPLGAPRTTDPPAEAEAA